MNPIEFENITVTLSSGEHWVTTTTELETRVKFPFHRAEKSRGLDLWVKNDGDANRTLSLKVVADEKRWNSNWVRWTVVSRTIGEFGGGESLAALETQAQRPGSCTVHLKANAEGIQDQRLVRLDFDIPANGVFPEGTYKLRVVIADYAENGHGKEHEFFPLRLSVASPPSKSLDGLPSIYQSSEEPGRTGFFQRFLLGLDESFEDTVASLGQMEQLFGPFGAPAEFLEWLATWVVMPLDSTWTQMKRRKLIEEAIELHSRRGTLSGLARMLEIYTGSRPTIKDTPVEGARLTSKFRLGKSETRLGDITPGSFVVTLAVDDHETVREEIVRMIIEQNKPAHTAYSLRLLRKLPGDQWSAQVAEEDPEYATR